MAKIKKTGRHTGAIKALRQSLKRRGRNRGKKEGLKALYKSFSEFLKSKNIDKAKEVLVKTHSAIDKAAKVGIYHWKTAARKKSKLSLALNKLLPVKS